MLLQNEISRKMAQSKDEIIREEIILQAQKLFKQFGLKKTTMDEIAAACGKAKSTLYHYFKNKEEVFDGVVQMEMVNLRKYVKNRVEEHKNMQDKIMTYVKVFHKEVINKANLYRIMIGNNITELKAQKHFVEMMKFEQSYIIRIMEDGYDSGEYVSVERKDIPWIAEIFLAAFYGVVMYNVETYGFYDEEKMTKTVELIVPRTFC